MTFWTERLELSKPCVCLMNIEGRDCVAYKEDHESPTVYYFPINPLELDLVLGLVIDCYSSVVSRTFEPEVREELGLSRERLNRLTNSKEELPI